MLHYNLQNVNTEINMRGVQAKTIVNHKHATIKNLLLKAGESIPTHFMPVDVTFFVLEGSGTITIGEETFTVKKHDIVLCPIKTGMSVQADVDSPLSFINIKTPGI